MHPERLTLKHWASSMGVETKQSNETKWKR